MRRLLAVPLLALGLVAGSGQVALADRHVPDLPAQAAERASQALEAARDARSGRGGEASLALADLRLAYDDLSAADRKQADGLFARPTDPVGVDPDSYGTYQPWATKQCTTHFCVHYTTNGPDKSTAAFVDQVKTTMERVRYHQVDQLGFRAPYPDGAVGGDARFDVYLANLGDEAIYGYCVPEYEVDPNQYRAIAYCVLDNGFTEFPRPGLPSLLVTAAHEFFHAVQFNYDYAEDRWLMEATATWMEERFASQVNDNRQYLGYGQLGRPGLSLDTFEPNGLAQYGQWIFFEKLSRTYGQGAIRALWNRMDSAFGEARDQYSTQAIRNFLASKNTTFPRFYAAFAAGNLLPARSYPEGSAYRPAPVTAGYRLTNGTRSTGWRAPRINHLANKNYRFVAGATLTGRWRLKVSVDLPNRATGSAAWLIVHRKDGTKRHVPVALDAYGNATVHVGFSRATVAQVTLTLANASTRFNCWRNTNYSCQGTPLDNGRYYKFRATAVR